MTMEQLQTVQDIFSDKLLKVPDYQRGYSWERKQWDDLLDDIDLIEKGQEHYTGTLVLHKSSGDNRFQDESGREMEIYDIVDGQQRLTTVVLLLDNLARRFQSHSDVKYQTLGNGIYKNYISIKDFHGNTLTKLKLNRDCHAYFENCILSRCDSLEGPNIWSHRRLKDAQEYFQSYFDRKSEEITGGESVYLEWLRDFHKKLTSSLKLTVYEVPKAADVGVIFEVMNNRGKPLSEMEKVKNYLLYLASKTPTAIASEMERNINETWTKIFEALMKADAKRADEDQLLRSHWLMAYDYDKRNWDGVDSIKKEFPLKEYRGKHQELREAVTGYVQSLGEACIAYCDIIRGEDAPFQQIDDDRIRSKLRKITGKLIRIKAVASFLPVLMAVRLRVPNDHETYYEFLKLAEKYTFRVYRFLGRRSDTGLPRFNHIANMLYRKEIEPLEALNKVGGTLVKYSPNKEYFEEYERKNNWYAWQGLKYFLYEYEEFLARSGPIKIKWSYLEKADKEDTIEHILPQTPDKEYWRERWNNEQIEKCLHDIGNLSITFDNSSYSNKSFPDKKQSTGQCYANAPTFMEQALKKYEDWTERECLDRKNDIVTWAKDRWGIDETKYSEYAREEDLEEETAFDEDDVADDQDDMDSNGMNGKSANGENDGDVNDTYWISKSRSNYDAAKMLQETISKEYGGLAIRYRKHYISLVYLSKKQFSFYARKRTAPWLCFYVPTASLELIKNMFAKAGFETYPKAHGDYHEINVCVGADDIEKYANLFVAVTEHVKKGWNF